MKAYPIELRQRVLAAVDKKVGIQKAITELYEVSLVWLKKRLPRWKTTRAIVPLPAMQGRKPAFDAKRVAELNRFITTQPDACGYG